MSTVSARPPFPLPAGPEHPAANPAITIGVSTPPARDEARGFIHPSMPQPFSRQGIFLSPDIAGENAGSFLRAAARVHPEPESGWRRNRLKFLLRALLHPLLTRRWLTRLDQPDTAFLLSLRPRLAEKLQRPYLCHGWTPSQRLAALCWHYGLLGRLMAPTASAAVLSGGLTLLRLQILDTALALDLRLAYQDQFEKEGDLSLLVEDPATGIALAGITFSLLQVAGRRAFLLGGVQGSPDPIARDKIRAVARAVCGLRAKALALDCVRTLARAWEIDDLFAVGDGCHVYSHSAKQRRIRASYDAFWEESDGLPLPGVFWSLPTRRRLRPRNEIKPSRRKAHEQRYRLLSRLQCALTEAVRALAPSAVAENPERFHRPVLFTWRPEPATAPLGLELGGELEPDLRAGSPGLKRAAVDLLSHQ